MVFLHLTNFFPLCFLPTGGSCRQPASPGKNSRAVWNWGRGLNASHMSSIQTIGMGKEA